MDESLYRERLRELWRINWPKGVPMTPAYPFGEILLTDYLRARARNHPDKPALIFYGAVLTFGELDRLSDRFAASLFANGARPGDRVAVFLPNCPQFAIAFYGILKLGCIHVPASSAFTETELRHELIDSGATAIVCLDRLLPTLSAIQAETSVRLVYTTSLADVLPGQPTIPVPASLHDEKIACPGSRDFFTALEHASPDNPPVSISLDDIAALNYTGGTTGLPKGCIHTQRSMIYTAATTCSVGMGLSSEHVSLCFYPVFWIAGEVLGVILPVFSGATCVLLGRWDPAGAMAAIERYRVTHASFLVDNAVEIIGHPLAHRYDLRSLQTVRVSSFVKKLSPTYRRRWRELTGATMIEATWGMTETHTCDTFTRGMQDNDVDLMSQPVFVGLPVPGTEFKICDFETGALLQLGTEGEISVRTPSLLKGYWNAPAETSRALRDGWLQTGDLGVLDVDGYLHFLGRRKEMLKVKGMSVFPAEIEARLGQHPAVIGSGVIGREDAESGEVPVAFVQLAADQGTAVSAEDLRHWCRSTLSPYKIPEVRLVAQLPMTASGKVRKEALVKML